MRKLEGAGQGAVTLERVSRREDVPRFLADVERITAQGWRAENIGERFRADAETHRQYTERAEHGWLRSYLLRCGDTPVASIVSSGVSGAS